MNTCRSLGSVPVPQIGYQKLGTLIDWDNPVFFLETSLSMDWFFWEHLQETIDFPMENMGLSCKFPFWDDSSWLTIG
jgi:hypothetical protein